MAANVVSICNRALQLLGAKLISDFDENSVNARACRVCYEPLRDKLLRRHSWNFATKRAQLAAESPAPDFGRGNSYPLPTDYLQLLKPYAEDNTVTGIDYEVENGRIVSDRAAPLEIRYTAKIDNVAEMDPLFREALSHEMAIAMCEQITQSSTKKAGLKDDYADVMAQARKANAFEKVAQKPPEDEWVTIRA